MKNKAFVPFPDCEKRIARETERDSQNYVRF
jgi:hypothetical protein